MRKLFEFNITMCGWGNSIEEAWDNCQESFRIEDEPIPENYNIIDEEDV